MGGGASKSKPTGGDAAPSPSPSSRPSTATSRPPPSRNASIVSMSDGNSPADARAERSAVDDDESASPPWGDDVDVLARAPAASRLAAAAAPSSSGGAATPPRAAAAASRAARRGVVKSATTTTTNDTNPSNPPSASSLRALPRRAPGAPPPPPPRDPDELRVEARLHAVAGRLAESSRHYDLALERQMELRGGSANHPDCVRALKDAADAYVREYTSEGALDDAPRRERALHAARVAIERAKAHCAATSAVHGEGSAESAAALCALARVYATQGAVERAEVVYDFASGGGDGDDSIGDGSSNPNRRDGSRPNVLTSAWAPGVVDALLDAARTYASRPARDDAVMRFIDRAWACELERLVREPLQSVKGSDKGVSEKGVSEKNTNALDAIDAAYREIFKTVRDDVELEALAFAGIEDPPEEVLPAYGARPGRARDALRVLDDAVDAELGKFAVRKAEKVMIRTATIRMARARGFDSSSEEDEGEGEARAIAHDDGVVVDEVVVVDDGGGDRLDELDGYFAKLFGEDGAMRVASLHRVAVAHRDAKRAARALVTWGKVMVAKGDMGNIETPAVLAFRKAAASVWLREDAAVVERCARDLAGVLGTDHPEYHAALRRAAAACVKRRDRPAALRVTETLVDVVGATLGTDSDAYAASASDAAAIRARIEFAKTEGRREEDKARSIHWSPYDPVGVVNAVP